MKKMISVLLALVLALGVCGAFAEESSALPAYAYQGDDPIWKAVVEYMQATDFGFEPEAGGVLIPTPIILKTVYNDDETEATVYGNFWIFCYKRSEENSKILAMTSGGENPGYMKLEKKDGVWAVTSMVIAGSGDDYQTDIVKFADGDKELEEQYFLTAGASENSMLPQYQRAAVVEYVAANNLDIEAYQETGWDPVAVND